MNIVRWEPFREMEDLLTRFERMIPRAVLPRWAGQHEMTAWGSDWTPAVDITETDTEFQIEAELPEVEKKDVKIEIQDGHLAISGERKHEREEKGEKAHRVERYYGRFSRTFALPANVEPEKAKADYKNGVLRVHLPKTLESAKSKVKQIEIH